MPAKRSANKIYFGFYFGAAAMAHHRFHLSRLPPDPEYSGRGQPGLENLFRAS